MAKECRFNFNKDVTWKIDPTVLNSKCKRLSNVSIRESIHDVVEYAGSFRIFPLSKSSCNSTKCTKVTDLNLELHEFKKGSGSSVKTPEGYLSFHTHPFSCYKSEMTIWGWPSGEDMRECIVFMLQGAIAHIVITLEGIYIIYVNPNILALLTDDKELKKAMGNIDSDPDYIRGFLVSFIESYFKGTHGHRCVPFNEMRERIQREKIMNGEKISDSDRIVSPEDWKDLVNNFSFSRVMRQSKGCKNSIACGGIPNHDDDGSSLSLKDFFEMFGLEPYKMNTEGKLYKTSSRNEDRRYEKFSKSIQNVIKYFNSPRSTKINFDKTKRWKPGQWFRVDLMYNEFEEPLNSGKFVGIEKFIESRVKEAESKDTSVSSCIHNFWNRAHDLYMRTGRNRDIGFKFNSKQPLSIKFKGTHEDGSCHLVKGDQIKNFIKQVHGQTPTKLRKRIPKNKYKKINRFGLNINKR